MKPKSSDVFAWDNEIRGLGERLAPPSYATQWDVILARSEPRPIEAHSLNLTLSRLF
jgi:hypothetical protein